MLRILVIAELASFIVAVAAIDAPITFSALLASRASFYELALLSSMLILFAVSNWIRRIRQGWGEALVALVAMVMSVASAWMLQDPEPGYPVGLLRSAMLSGLLSGLILWYFNWRHRILSPALSEARLMALQARIRPHFLFNSLNTVLGLMREEPRRAERVLENLAELYRALLSETGTLVPLGRELDLAHAYAEIEAMRLGPRLVFNWQCQGAPLDALVPPLIIQPLLENAVYHGVEPAEAGGTVDVTIFLKGEQLHLVVRNHCEAPSRRRSGNHMALTNIRERLALHFDAESEMSAYKAGVEFVVQIRMPYKHVSH